MLRTGQACTPASHALLGAGIPPACRPPPPPPRSARGHPPKLPSHSPAAMAGGRKGPVPPRTEARPHDESPATYAPDPGALNPGA